MKWFLSLLAVVLSGPASAQNGPPAKASYVFNVSLGTWVADTTTTDAGVGDLPNAPPAAALYCLNTATNQWTPATTAGNCFGSSAGGATWGSITGTLSSQTDLNTALSAKLPLAGGPMTGATGGNPIAGGINATQYLLNGVALTGSSPLTTKGDLYGFSTVNARLPVGTDTYVLTADSTQTLGIKWAAPSGGSGNYANLGDLVTPPTASGCTWSSAPAVCTVSGTVAAVTFSSLPTGYTNLIITFQGNSTYGGTGDQLVMQFNGDSGSHYWSSATVPSNCDSSSASSNNGQAFGYVLQIYGEGSGHFADGTIVIPNYSVTTVDGKTYHSYGNTWTQTHICGQTGAGWWNDGLTSSYPAITSITFQAGTGSNISVGTTFTIEATN